MTPRQRLHAAIEGQPVDRVPWSPFLAYWWECQPIERQESGQIRFLREIGADALLRGFGFPFVCSDILGLREYEVVDEIPGCKICRTVKGPLEKIEYETPVGTLTTVTQFSPEGNTKFVVEHPLRTAEDCKILSYLVERMLIRSNYETVRAAIDEVGEHGIHVPVLSPFQKTPFQSLVEHFMGTQQLAYALADYPEDVEALLAVMSERAMEAVEIAIDSPADTFITWEDTSTTNMSPTQFSCYVLPDLNRWGQRIHAAGKHLIHHACGHLKALLPVLASEEVDMIESITPPPTGNVELPQAQAALMPKVGVIGGIEPTHFLNLGLPEFTAYVENLLDCVDPMHFILANSDSCPPGVSLEKFHRVTAIVSARRL